MGQIFKVLLQNNIIKKGKQISKLSFLSLGENKNCKLKTIYISYFKVRFKVLTILEYGYKFMIIST